MITEQTKYITFDNLALEYHLSDRKIVNTYECNNYLEQIEKDDIMPFTKGTFRFSSDFWDFSPYTSLNINKVTLRFHFEPFPICYKNLEKKYVLVSMLDNKIKIQTIYERHRCLRVFFSYLETKGIRSLEYIDINEIEGFINYLIKKGLVITSITIYKNSLLSFLLFYETNIAPLSSDTIFEYLNTKNKKKYKAYADAHKSAPIPDWYYNKLLAGLIHYMNDDNCPFYIKGPACIYILLSQIGIRCGELLSLDSRSSLRIKVAFNGEEIPYLYYESWKGQRGNNTRSENFTYINALAKKAFDTLVNIPEYKERRKKMNVDYLFCGGKFIASKETIPFSSHHFTSVSEYLWKRLDIDGYLETINLDHNKYPFLVTRKVLHNSKKDILAKGVDIKTISYPSTQQFRFHVCTELYNKGVPLAYIKRFMSHLTDSMVEYHILNDKNKIQEDLEAAKKVLKGIVTGDEKIIGGDKGLSSNIQKFIEENHFNVEKDLDAIVSKLAEDIPVRIKTGGVCIKSSRIRPCSIDSRTDEMYCAYNVCPNIFHFFYHCGITWRKCKELKEAIDINQKRGLLKQVYKDTNNLRSIISHQLLPEMDELQVQLKDKGINTIYEKYPDLIDIIDNFDEIKKEVTSWLQKIQQN